MTGTPDGAVEDERGGQDRAASQHESARADPVDEPAQARAQEPVDKDEDGERAREQRSAPAEVVKERDEEDAVGVPDAVDEAEGDEGRRDGAATGGSEAHVSPESSMV